MAAPQIAPPGIRQIREAAERLKGRAIRTPLLRSAWLDELTGAQVFVKPECLQLTGSFKFRGAFNAASALPEDARKAGLVACSSGNHAQGVAEAARLLGVPATIVMPADAPAIKLARTRRSGAKVVTYDREIEDRDAIAAQIVEQTGANFIHPFENPFVIAGQGTCGLEAAEDIIAAGNTLDRVLVCTGGGGLTAGVAIATQEYFPNALVHSVEPERFDDHRRSLASGERLANERKGGSACDALLSEMPGELTFSVNSSRLHSGLAVSDSQAFAAMRFAFEEFKLVAEPGGAVSLAALLAQGRAFAGETVLCLISGGNVDPAVFARVLEEKM